MVDDHAKRPIFEEELSVSIRGAADHALVFDKVALDESTTEVDLSPLLVCFSGFFESVRGEGWIEGMRLQAIHFECTLLAEDPRIGTACVKDGMDHLWRS